MNTFNKVQTRQVNKTKHILSALIISLMFGIFGGAMAVASPMTKAAEIVTQNLVLTPTSEGFTIFELSGVQSRDTVVYDYGYFIRGTFYIGASKVKEVTLGEYQAESGFSSGLSPANGLITIAKPSDLAFDTNYNFALEIVYQPYDDNADYKKQQSNMVSIVFKQPVELPADPVKDGYNFVGWYYDIELTQAYDNAPIYSDTNLYAKFDIKTYTANYYVDGEIFKADTVEHFSKLTAHTAEKVGYNFIGWYTDSALTQAYDFANATVSGAVNLYAKFEVIMLKVSFYLDDGTLFDTINVEYGSTLAQTPAAALMISVFGGQLFTDSARTMSMSVDEPITAELSLNGDMSNSAKTGAKVGAWLADNWLWVAICAVVIIGGTAFVAYKVKRGK